MTQDNQTAVVEDSSESRFISRDKLIELCPAVAATTPDSNVSKKYAFVPTLEIVDKLNEYGFKPVGVQGQTTKTHVETRTLRQKVASVHGAHLITFEPEHEISILGKEGRLQVVLLNSHDRTRRFSLKLGVFRLVCTNGLIVGTMEASVTKFHLMADTGDIYDRIEETLDQTNVVHDSIAKMQGVTLTQDRANEFAAAAIKLRYFNGQPPVNVESVLAARRPVDEGLEMWKVFNRVQENLVKGGLKSVRTSKAVTTKEVTTAKQLYRLNLGLWNLAANFSSNN